MELTGQSSNQNALFSRLAKALPALLRRKKLRAKPARQRQVQRRLTAQQVEQLVAEYMAGDDMTVLAARWGLHRTTVAGHLRRADIVLRRQGIPAESMDEAIRLYGEDWSCLRLAERYGCDDETVRKTLKRAGVHLRKPWERP